MSSILKNSRNNYKVYIKNLVGTKKDIIVNNNTTIFDLKKTIIELLYKNNKDVVLENFPYYIIYKGSKINKEYDLNTTMSELEINNYDIFYIIDDLECKKLIEKASSMLFTPTSSLVSSRSKLNDNRKEQKKSYSDGCFASKQKPNLSPSKLILNNKENKDNNINENIKHTRKRYNSISDLDLDHINNRNDIQNKDNSEEFNSSSDDIIGLSQLSLISNGGNSMNLSKNSSRSISSVENSISNIQDKKRSNSRHNRDYILSKFHPPRLNINTTNSTDDKILSDSSPDDNEDNNTKLDNSQELILEALKRLPQFSPITNISPPNSPLRSPSPPSLPINKVLTNITLEMQKTIKESLDEIKNIKISQSQIIKYNENKDNTTLLINNTKSIDKNTDINNSILSYLKKINSESKNNNQVNEDVCIMNKIKIEIDNIRDKYLNEIKLIKDEHSKIINKEIESKFKEKILKIYKNIIKNKEEQLIDKQEELYITKSVSIFSTGLLIVLLFFHLISSTYK